MRWMMTMCAALLLGLHGAAQAAQAVQAASGAAPPKAGTVASITDGDTLTLIGGQVVRLVGIQAPKLPLGRAGFRPWPRASEAKAHLTKLAQGKTLTLRYHGREIDRYGRLLAHLYGPDGAWIQGEMLKSGLARVYSFADNRALIAEMLARERAARAARRGIWADPFYGVRNVTETPKFIGTFQLVEGKVRRAALVKGKLYLNFGADWRRDFTIFVSAKDLRAFGPKSARASLADSYTGHTVRVRGWIRRFNGPMIAATHPEQIERIED